MSEIEVKIIHGQALNPWLSQLAQLRITVFREFPYLYEGSMAYEAKYLQTYVDSPSSIAVLLLDGDTLIGASTGLPLADETPEFSSPFHAAGLAAKDYFYCAETVILPAYRGHGLYRGCFEAREARAQELDLKHSCFASVLRPEDHPRRPSEYQALDLIWQRYGYTARPDLQMSLAWQDLDEDAESPKTLQFYIKPLT